MECDEVQSLVEQVWLSSLLILPRILSIRKVMSVVASESKKSQVGDFPISTTQYAPTSDIRLLCLLRFA